MSTVVIGGGVVGLCVAAELAQRSRDVIVLDAGANEDEASALSCGWLTVAHSRPLANPGNMRRSMGWLMRRRGPLSIRPHLDPSMLRWLLGFAWSSRPGVHDAGLEAMATLSGEALSAYDELARAGLDIEYETAGTLVAFNTEAALEEEVEAMAVVADLGLAEFSVVRGAEMRALEPALSGGTVGAIHSHQDRVLRPEALMGSLRAHLEGIGVDIRRSMRVVGFERSAGRITAVRTERETVATDEVILAAGVWSQGLGAKLGARLPVQAGRGYTIDIDTNEGVPSHLVELGEASMVVVPFASGLRLCGTMEIARSDDPPDARRSRLMLESTRAYLPDLEFPSEPTVRIASRPMTPDDLPIIGRLPDVSNVAVATGHGMLGVTLAPVTARALADELEGRDGIDLRPFSPSRFA